MLERAKSMSARRMDRRGSANENGVEVTLMGGLGNQLFQLAAGLQVARKSGLPLFINTSWFAGQDKRMLEVAPLIAVLDDVYATPARRVRAALLRESGFSVSQGILDAAGSTRLGGFFQSPLYFHDVSEELRAAVLHVMSTQLSPATRAVVMHVRRGDYVANAKINEIHGTPSLKYYLASADLMASLTGSTSIQIFSDDPEWSARILMPLLESASYCVAAASPTAVNAPALESLAGMVGAPGYILSNSTFGWWAAWLSNADNVVAPRPWFASEGRDTRDLLPFHWLTRDSRG